MVQQCPSSILERDLRQRLVARHHEAMAELFEQFASVVFELALHVAEDEGTAATMANAVFLRLEDSAAFDVANTIRPWLAMTSNSRAVERVRREQVARCCGTSAHHRVEPGPTDREQLETLSAVTDRARTALDSLAENERLVVRLTYLGGRTYQQAAAELNISETVARSRVGLGVEQVARRLAPQPALSTIG